MIIGHLRKKFTGLSIILQDFSSIETVQNKRSISFRLAPHASDFKVIHHRSYSRCFLSVYLHGTPRRSLSNEILPELVKPTKTQSDTIANIDVYPFNSQPRERGRSFPKDQKNVESKTCQDYVYLPQGQFNVTPIRNNPLRYDVENIIIILC